MTHRATTLERAYELAQSGEHSTVGGIKAQLKAEGRHDVEGQLYGRTVQSALRNLCAKARDARAEDAPQA